MSTAQEKSLPQEPIQADQPQRKWSKRWIGLAGTVFLTGLGLVLWQTSKPEEILPEERQQHAMELLEAKHDSPRNRRLARKIALELQELKYHDPDFPSASSM